MNARNSIIFSLFATIIASASVSLAPHASGDAIRADDLPTARQVIDAFIKARGGEKAIRSHTSRQLNGTMSIPSMNLSGSMVVYQAVPNFSKTVIDIPGMGKSMQGTNGKVFWQIDPTRGPSLMKGEMLLQAQMDSHFHSDLEAEKLWDEIKVVGESEFNGKPCIEVLQKKGELESTVYYNKETHLVEGTKQTAATEMGNIPIVTTMSDWKKVENTWFPYLITQDMTTIGIKQVMTIKTVTLNKVDPSVFTLPKPIEALVDAKSKTKTKSKTVTDSDSDSSSSSSSSKDSDSSSSSSSSKDSDSSSSSSSSKDSDSSSSSSSSKDSSSSKSSKKSKSSNSSSSSSSNSSSSGGTRGG